jgi:hypothetical protein
MEAYLRSRRRRESSHASGVGFALEVLGREIQMLSNQDRWVEYLRFQARFRSYSPHNTLLILSQFPEASWVAGRRVWEELGRQVKKSAEPIRILAPVFRYAPGEDQDRERRLVGFRMVAVYDVSQTEGDPLPTPVVPLRGVPDPSHVSAAESIASGLGFCVRRAPMPLGQYGACDFSRGEITIAEGADPLHSFKTLVHELTHALLHQSCNERDKAEVEAESVAFLVLQCLGYDAKGYSPGYVLSWAGSPGEALRRFTTLGRRITRTACEILEMIDTSSRGEEA